MSLGLFHLGGLVFQLVCRNRYWAYSSKSTVQPKMESCFQDGACSVCFLLHFPFLILLCHTMSITHRDILHPGSPTANLGERHQPLGYKVHQFSSIAQSCPALFDPMNRSMPGLPVHHQLRSSLKLMYRSYGLIRVFF